jgi:hypothetical protein
VHYNPANPSTPAETGVSIDNDEFEFIELLNTGTGTLDLTGVQFTAGITYTFGAVSLPGGSRILLVKNQAAFTARYGASPPPAGVYSGNLKNGGDTITLLDATGAVIQNFTYSDAWHSETDGVGYSLIAIRPDLPLSRDLSSNWRRSAVANGNPATTDAVGFTGDPNADQDKDGLSALLEYAMGTSDLTFTGPGFIRTKANNDSLTVEFTTRLVADDAVLVLE